MKLYEKQFSRELDLSPSTPATRTVLIASTPRCGSHMLGHAMATTGCLGVPFEYANPSNLAEWARITATDAPEATLQAVMARRTTGNGMFSIKAHHSQCATLGGVEPFLAFWPNLTVVHIYRADVLRQAISYAVARQTGVWITGQEAEQTRAEFDPDLIAQCLDDIAVQNARWTSAFAAAGLRPLTLRYESVAKDLAGAVTQIARHAGVIGPRDTLAVTAATKPQGISARTEEWIRRYADGNRAAPARRYGLARLARMVRS